MGSIAPIADKLAKPARLLSSDNAAEVAAVGRALMRTLRENGPDIYDLAQVIEGGDKKFSESEALEIYQQAFAHGQRSVQTNPRAPSWLEIVEHCYDAFDRLSERDQSFIRSIRPRIRLGGEPSEKQAKWLKDVYRRVHMNGTFHAI
jgi:hypothetical protein